MRHAIEINIFTLKTNGLVIFMRVVERHDDAGFRAA